MAAHPQSHPHPHPQRPHARAQAPSAIHLRVTARDDVPRLFELHCDPDANTLAATKPREHAAFMARWDEIMRDAVAAGVIPRVIIADGVLVGSINIVTEGGADSIGYWLAREHWGRGIATRAIALMLAEVGARPLFAKVVTHNVASLRALERNGFVETSRARDAATARNVEREMVTLVLR